MLFNSYIFVCLFFPVCLLGYYKLAPIRQGLYAKCLLVIMSLWFYGYFNLQYLAIMLGSIGFNYLFHKRLSAKRDKSLLVIAVTANLMVLFYFKYFDFFIENINRAFRLDLPLQQILLPLGISFFTFQQIGFVVDTYRGECQNVCFLDYALFVSFFPQLIAGPIVNHQEMLPQFHKIQDKKWDTERFVRGFTLFVLGLVKKVLVADTFGAAVDHGYLYLQDLHSLDCFLLMIWYTLQLYFDFSGYCDMARGIGKMLGIQIPVNFNSPYKAVNIVDFWKRWHITLNRFFTKYLYIPLGGNRVKPMRMYGNLLLVFFLSGLWHGAGWNYILWGMLHGVLYVVTRALQRRRSHGAGNVVTFPGESGYGFRGICKRTLGCAFTFFYVAIAWVFFRASSVTQGLALLKKMFACDFTKVNYQLASQIKPDEFWYVVKILHLDQNPFSPYLLMTVITVLALVVVFFGKNAAELTEKMKGKAFSALLVAGLFVWCVLTFSEVSSFLYFNF